MKISGNYILIDTLRSINELMRYMMLKIKTDTKISENAFKAHKEILHLLESGDLEKAKDVNKLHILDLNNRLTKKYLKAQAAKRQISEEFVRNVAFIRKNLNSTRRTVEDQIRIGTEYTCKG